jgi:DNA-binding transcriptional MerR regulator
VAELPEKAADAFRTISEVAAELGLPQHVLRFWETKFAQIKPMKRGGGRRYYRPEDVELLRGIRLFLYSEGYTIRGVQRVLKEKGVGFVAAVGRNGSAEATALPDAAEKPAEEALPAVAPQPEAPLAPAPRRAKAAPRSAEPPAPEIRPAPAPQASPGFDPVSRRQLERALGELVEAKRLLDQAR